MGEAGFNFTILVATTKAGTYSELSSNTGEFNRSADVLDDTDTTNAGYHTRLLGLLDTAASTETNWAASQTALDLVESAFENRTELWFKVLPNGVTSEGKKMEVVVENISESFDVTGLVKTSYSFQGKGVVFADDAV